MNDSKGHILSQIKSTLMQIACLAGTIGAAFAGPLEGDWQQASSNAGHCGNCTISVAALDDFTDTLSVSSNNGWSAKVTKALDDDEFADGYGRWNDNVGGAYAGKPFKITLLEEQDTMRMVMEMLDRAMPGEVIASFDRSFLDNYNSYTVLGASIPYSAQSWGGIVRTGPGMHHEKMGSLYEGQQVTILGRTNEIMNGYPWMMIEYGDYRQRGYQWGGIICTTDYPRQDLHQLCAAPQSQPSAPLTIYQDNTLPTYPARPTYMDQFEYYCQDGSQLGYQLDNRASEALAIVDYDGKRHFLVQVISGSGSRYSNGELEIHSKGRDVLVTKDHRSISCTEY